MRDQSALRHAPINGISMVTVDKAIEQLPSLPQVLVHILDAIYQDTANFQRIADIIRQDAAMSARIISVANSSFFGRPRESRSIERALLYLGTDTVKTVVITAAIKQFFGRFRPSQQAFLKGFWRRSLISANFAQILANLTSYQTPEEAYLCGLLADVGQLMLMSSHGEDYQSLLDQAQDDRDLIRLERQAFQRDHCELGAVLVDSWQLSPFMADALRYQHEETAQVQDAQHLVKIVNLACHFSGLDTVDDAAAADADALFGFNAALTRELHSRIGADVTRIAQSLGIDIGVTPEDDEDAHQQLGQRLGELGQLSQFNSELWRAQSWQGMQRAVQRSLFMTLGIRHSLLFLVDPERQLLEGSLEPEGDRERGDSREPHTASHADFSIPLMPGRSLLATAALTGAPQSGHRDGAPLSVVDQQLLRHCHGKILLCLPLRDQDEALGAIAAGLDDAQLAQFEQRQRFVEDLCAELARSLQSRREQLQRLDSDSTDGLWQERVREAIHEAGNPLSIVRNYLEMLRTRLGEEHAAHKDLQLIREEIDRVGAILLRLGEPPDRPGNRARVDVNATLRDLSHVVEQSRCASRGISLSIALDEHCAPLEVSDIHLRQVLTNLLKNAAEALGEGGEIRIETQAQMSVNGRKYLAITIADNGPGLPQAVQDALFHPVISTKGGNHSGLGLSIVKKLVDEMGGTILCASGNAGTRFQLLLPK